RAATRRPSPAEPPGPGSRRGEASAAPLRAVAGARLLAIGDARRVERGADDLVPEARQIGRAAAANEDDRVLLQVVALAGDVGADLHAVRQADTGHLAQRRVRLTRSGRVHARADAPLLRGAGERRRLGLCLGGLAALAHELIDSRHESFV